MLYPTRSSLITAGTVLAIICASPGPAHPQQGPADFTQIVARMSPAVVGITSTREVEQQQPRFDMLPPPLAERFRDQMPSARRAQALGSGFLISREGHIVTNNHVVQKATEIEVLLSDGTTRAAELVGNDPATDIAVLKIGSIQDMAVASWGDSDAILPGAWTIAIGSPFGLGGTVTVGVLSARSRDIHSGPYDDYLQTDASVNRGNSGGPLFDANGEVIGVNTAIVSPSGGNIGIGFAVPSRTAQRVVDQLIETGTVERGYIGVRLQEISQSLARALNLEDQNGALIAQVESGGPAEIAGLQEGDVIVAFAGQPVEGPRTLSFAVAEQKPGEEVSVTIRRDGEEMTLPMTLAARDSDAGSTEPTEPETAEGDRLGLALSPVPDALRGSLEIEGGLVVQRVQPESPAERAGLQQGDVILQAQNTPVAAVSDLASAWNAAREEETPLLLRIMRKETSLFIAVEG